MAMISRTARRSRADWSRASSRMRCRARGRGRAYQTAQCIPLKHFLIILQGSFLKVLLPRRRVRQRLADGAHRRRHADAGDPSGPQQASMRFPMKSHSLSRMPRRLMAIAFFLLALGACAAVGPEHEVPVAFTGPGWTSPNAGSVDAAALAAWWKTFGDAELERVVELALANNLDLRQADLAIEAARAQLGRAEANTAPIVAVKGGAQRSRSSLNAPEYNAPASPEQTVYDSGLDASWEIDLFGSLRRQRESAQAAAQISCQADATALRTSIAAETARTYFTLRGAQRELVARQASVEALQGVLELVRHRVKAGDLPTAVEVERAQARLDQARALLPNIEARRQAAAIALKVNRRTAGIAVVACQPPGIDLALHAIPVGERADILRRRPDIASAERQLAVATADTGVATAELFQADDFGERRLPAARAIRRSSTATVGAVLSCR